MQRIDRINLNNRIALIAGAEDDPIIQEDVYLNCKEDTVFFFQYFIWGYDPRTPPYHFPFIPFEAQVEYIKAIDTEIKEGRGSVTEKSRDMGATYLTLGVYLKRFLFDSDFEALLLSLRESEVDNPTTSSLFGKIRYMAKRIPFWLMPKGFRWKVHGDNYLKIINPESGNTIIGMATTADAGRSGRKTAVLVDEYAAISPRVLEGLERSLPEATNTIHRLSTPRGINQFKRVRDKGLCKIHTLHWTANPWKTEDLFYYDYRGIRRDVSDLPYNRRSTYGYLIDESGKVTNLKLLSSWYENKKREYLHARDVAQELDLSYFGSGMCRFDASTLEEKSKHCRPGKRGRLIRVNGVIEFVQAADGQDYEIEIWQFPTLPYYVRRSAAGVDTAEGLEKGDYCTADVLVVQVPGTGVYHAAALRGHWTPDIYAEKLIILGEYYDGGAEIAGERNKDGLGVLLNMRKAGYNNLFYETGAGNVSDRLGFLTTERSKYVITAALDEALRTGELVTESIEHFGEMSTFLNTSGKLGAVGQDHDDRVISLAIAWHVIKQYGKPVQKEGPRRINRITSIDTTKY
jgi:hypothetical protein